MKIVICSSEVVPFAKTGGMADVAGALPLALENLGHQVIVVMPKYRCVEEANFPVKKVKTGFYSATIGKNIHPVRDGLPKAAVPFRSLACNGTAVGRHWRPISNGVKVYFIENEKYYHRPGLYGEKKGDYPDNLLRFSFYCRKALELLKIINFKADIIHCNDWQTALIQILLKTELAKDNFYKKIKTVLTIHNLAYQGLFPKEEFPNLKLDHSLFSVHGFEFYGKINILKAGIIFSDLINTVSEAYAKEILTKELGCGLDGVLNERKKDLFGIVNGIDYSIWDPKKDRLIFKNFGADNLEIKKENKKELQKCCGLAVRDDIPLFGFVGRLAEQKGIDLLSLIIPEIKNLNIQLVILGVGDLKYHLLLEKYARKNPKSFSLNLKFDDTLAHRIYAASDLFLMPSQFEPCGLGQLISFKYGAVPVVHKTGGLADTVLEFDRKTQKGNGFTFLHYTKEAFLAEVKKTVSIYAQKNIWQDLVKEIMQLDFSWKESAKKYVDLYKNATRNINC